MTKLSKIIVVTNFAFSLIVAGWCLGLYFTRVDWTDTPAKEDRPAGLMVGRVAQLKQSLAESVPAEASWREARHQVRDRDSFRAADRSFYQKQIALVYNAADNQQLKEVPLGKDGQPDLDPSKGPLEMEKKLKPANDRFGQPLRSLSYYAKNYASNLDGLKKTGDELEELLKKDADFTVELAGGTLTNGTVVEKGLRKRIEDERVKGLDVLDEYDIVKPLLIKTVGDAEFLLTRRRQLEKRIKELEETKPVTKAQ